MEKKYLGIAEKPNQGKDYARILGCTKVHTGYIEGDRYIVTWAVGHLIGLKEPQEHDEKYRKWRLEDLPLVFPVQESLKVLPGAEKQFAVIKQLIHRSDVEMLINGGDAGREGELIQRWIYRMAGNRKPVMRLWVDDLTDKSIRQGFRRLADDRKYDRLFEEGEARAELDQILGYNYSRALSLTKAENITISYGRCQTPVLNKVVELDLEIESFVPKFYWILQGSFGFPKGQVTAVLLDEEDKQRVFENLEAAKQTAGQIGKQAQVQKITRTPKAVKPPYLYSITELQKDMAKRYGFSADKTLELAQTLYDRHKILSYPRTDSRFLSTNIKEEILDHLEAVHFGAFSSFIERIPGRGYTGEKQIPERYFNDAKVTDHHAIIPTNRTDIEKIYQTLTEDEKKVFDAVADSLIAIFYPDYEYETREILIGAGAYRFGAKGKKIKNTGWKDVIRTKGETDMEEPDLPDVSEGMDGQVEQTEVLDKKTQPKKRYTVEGILAMMEINHIGTGATRAEILKKLLTKKKGNPEAYLKQQKNVLISTGLARSFIRYIPEELRDIEMVSRIDKSLKQIEEGRLTKAEVLNQAVEELQHNLTRLKTESGEKIRGKAPFQKEKTTCPLCGREVTMNKGRTFYLCKGYFDKEKPCYLNVPTEVAGKKLTDKQIKALLTHKKTDLIQGFRSRKGDTFSAYLVLDAQGKTTYQYPRKRGGR